MYVLDVFRISWYKFNIFEMDIYMYCKKVNEVFWFVFFKVIRMY